MRLVRSVLFTSLLALAATAHSQQAEPAADAADLSEALEASRAKVERLVASLEEVRERRRYLEKVRSDNMARFDIALRGLFEPALP